ncbi:MAG: DegT/DnrJ/EryC1/StrS family aminotransferase, partial [Flavobacterium sp.]
DADMLKKMALLRNFGYSGVDSFSLAGINGKNSEFHAAMGVLNLKYIDDILEKRQLIAKRYDEKLSGLKMRRPQWKKGSENNNSYYPVIFNEEAMMHSCIAELKSHEIFTRRYFYPSLASSLPYLIPQELKITDDISSRVLCLPLYHELGLEEVDLICRLIRRIHNN